MQTPVLAHPGTLRRAGALVTLTALFGAWLIVAVAPPAHAALSGPAYPPPAGVTLAQSPATEAAEGKAGGRTWTFTNTSAGSYSHLFWGPWDNSAGQGFSTPTPRLAFDGAANTGGEIMTFSAGLSNLAGGVAVWTGSAPCKVVVSGAFVTETWTTRFTLTTTTTGGAPLALQTAGAAGLTNPGATVVLPVTGDFKAHLLFTAARPSTPSTFTPAVDLYNSLQTDPALKTITSFAAGFYWNRAPVASSASVSTNEDTAKPITLSASDADGNALTYSIVSGPSNGVLSGSGANRTYTPNLNFNGSDSFTFQVNDGLANSGVATVGITVNPVNDAPVATGQSVSTDEDTPLPITLTGTDVENDALTFSIASGPTNGMLVGSPPDLVYEPDANFNGSDSFTFIANDGLLDSAPATIDITVNPVNDAPVADTQMVTTAEDTPLAITLTGSDVDGDALSFAVVMDPAFGTLSGTAPNLTYTPDANYNGPDEIVFQVNDGLLDSPPAMIVIEVTPENDAPVADAQSVTTDEDTPIGITLSGSDTEGTPLNYTVVDAPAHGSLSGAAPNLTYTPDADYHGTDSFTFKVDDGELDSATVTVDITINSVNDNPVAADDTAHTPQYTAVTVNVLQNDSDVDGDTISVEAVGDPTYGTAVLNPDGTVTYTPGTNFKGSDSFTYTIVDGEGGSATGLVTILEVGCGEDGVDHLAGTPAQGTASATIDQTAEPAVGIFDPGLAQTLHDTNCDTVVPAEDSVDETIDSVPQPMKAAAANAGAAEAGAAAPQTPAVEAPRAPRLPE